MTKLEKEIAQSEKLVKFTKLLSKELKYYQKQKAKYGEMHDETQSRLNNVRDNIASSGELIRKTEHEIHCICVEMGLAKYEEERYLGNVSMGGHVVGWDGGGVSAFFRIPDVEIKK